MYDNPRIQKRIAKTNQWVQNSIYAPSLIMICIIVLGNFDSILSKTWFCFQIIKVHISRKGEDPRRAKDCNDTEING